jgi:hypothetical protein
MNVTRSSKNPLKQAVLHYPFVDRIGVYLFKYKYFFGVVKSHRVLIYLKIEFLKWLDFNLFIYIFKNFLPSKHTTLITC